MPKHYLLLSFLFFCISLPTSLAQELCNNQTDDDGDGLIDGFDCDCYSKRGNVWHFGAGFSVDFNGPDPQVLTGSPIDSPEGSASICDEDGNLLFFSDGGGRLPTAFQPSGTIWDQNSNPLYEMMGAEGGGWSAVQSSVFVPKPGSATNYYLFTMEEVEFNIDGDIPGQPQGRGLSYFEIDRSSNGGLGEVIVADERLFTPAYESLCAIQHANGEDYWVIIRNSENTLQREYVVFEATATGVSLSGNYIFDTSLGGVAAIKASPTGDRICQWSDTDVIFYDFDPQTGVISNPTEVPFDMFFGDFSPSGRYFYGTDGFVSGGNNPIIARIDLSTLSAASTFETIATIAVETFLPFGQWQLGPYGAIYFRFENDHLGAIRCADAETPIVEPEYLDLIGNPGSFFSGFTVGLPNFPNHFFYRPFLELQLTGDTEYEICGGETISLTVATNKCADLLWSTGATTDTITINTPGTYMVTATDECETQTLTINVTGTNSFDITASAPAAACIGNTVTALVDAPDGAIFSWFDQSGNELSTEQAFPFLLAQDTTLFVIATLDCGTAQATVSIDAIATPAPALDVSNAGCTNTEGVASITNPSPSSSITWLDGDGTNIGTGDTIDGLVAGAYSVLVVNSENGVDCSASLPFIIEAVPAFENISFTSIDNRCAEDQDGRIEVTPLDGTPPYTYQWTALANDSIIGSEAIVASLPNGTFQLDVTDASGCTLALTVDIQSPPPPNINLQADPAFCDNDNGSIFLSVDNNAPYSLFLAGEAITDDALIDLFPGTYQIEVVSEDGCLWLDSLVVVGNEVPFPIIRDTTILGFRERPIDLNIALPANDWIYSWSPTTGLSCTDCPRPFTILQEDQAYEVVVTDPDTDCAVSFTVNVVTRPPERVFIPNAFSPNDDGFNDLFEVFPSDAGVQLTSMQIFDRWGALVFESTASDASWDGTFNGQPMTTGVYVYVIEIQKSTGKDLMSGDVLLVR